VLFRANAFFIIFVISAIYSTVGVTFYSQIAPEQFGTFCRAFIAMFNITVGSMDWWFELFPPIRADDSIDFWPTAYVFSYVIVVDWVFFQVSIAVLLDNFLTASNDMKTEEKLRAIQQNQSQKHVKNPLDPLLLKLAKEYTNEAGLSTILQDLFKVLDSDNSGGLSSQEFQAAIKKLDFFPRIFISDSDFIAMTKNGALCNANGHLGPQEFENVMREQILNYTQSRMSAASEFWSVSDQDFTELGTLKQILMEQLWIKQQQENTRLELKRVLNHLEHAKTVTKAAANPSLSEEECLSGLSFALQNRFHSDQVGLTQEITSKIEQLKMDIKEMIATSEDKTVSCSEAGSMSCSEDKIMSYSDDDGQGNLDQSRQYLSLSPQRKHVELCSRLDYEEYNVSNCDMNGGGLLDLAASNAIPLNEIVSQDIALPPSFSPAKIQGISSRPQPATFKLQNGHATDSSSALLSRASSHNAGLNDPHVKCLPSITCNTLQGPFRKDSDANNDSNDKIGSNSIQTSPNQEMDARTMMVIARAPVDDCNAGIQKLESSRQLTQLNFSSLVIHTGENQHKEANCKEMEEIIIDMGSV